MSCTARVDCLRISVTDRCNMRCVYCMPAEGMARVEREAILTFEEIAAVVCVLKRDFGLRTVRLTGGEPLVRFDIDVLARMLAETGVEDLAVTTNGQLLPRQAERLKATGVSRVNISLDSLNTERFARLTRGGSLEATLAGIEAARAAGFRSIKLNSVVLRGENEGEVCDLARFALERGLEIRFLELMEIGVAVGRHQSWFVPASEVIDYLRSEFEVAPTFDSANPRVRPYRITDASGRSVRIGFIAPETHPFCAGCRRLRLTSDGRLLGCLMQAGGTDLKPHLRGGEQVDEADLREAISAAIAGKPATRAHSTDRLMASVGG